MITPAQTAFYWRAWAAVVRSHNWRMANGRLQGQRASMWVSPELNAVYQLCWDTAEALAAQQHRAVTVDDLRHGCHYAALGVAKSSTDFTNADCDAVLALFRLLAEPDRIENVINFDHAHEIGERRRYVFAIERAPQSYWQKIACDRFGHSRLDDLSLEELKQLAMTIRARLRKRPAAVPAPMEEAS